VVISDRLATKSSSDKHATALTLLKAFKDKLLGLFQLIEITNGDLQCTRAPVANKANILGETLF